MASLAPLARLRKWRHRARVTQTSRPGAAEAPAAAAAAARESGAAAARAPCVRPGTSLLLLLLYVCFVPSVAAELQAGAPYRAAILSKPMALLGHDYGNGLKTLPNSDIRAQKEVVAALARQSASLDQSQPQPQQQGQLLSQQQQQQQRRLLQMGPLTSAAGAAASDSLEAAARISNPQNKPTAAAVSTADYVIPGAVPPLYQELLDSMNAFRQDHGSPPLAWDVLLAAYASKWAGQCAFESDPSNSAGENVFATTTAGNVSIPLAMAAKWWYKQGMNYDYQQPAFSLETGGFTQLIWKNTTRVGCAVNVCGKGLKGLEWGQATMVVCRYSPPGNTQNGFRDNVLPLQPKQPIDSPSVAQTLSDPSVQSPSPQNPVISSSATGLEPHPSGSTEDLGWLPAGYEFILQQHNEHRSHHGAAWLAWDTAAAMAAATAASRCMFAVDPNEDFGENVFVSTTMNATQALGEAIDFWYSQSSNYAFNSPGYQQSAGSFTQVVWRSTTALGCAAQVCGNGIQGTSWDTGTLVVCKYSPGGNDNSPESFAENVKAYSDAPVVATAPATDVGVSTPAPGQGSLPSNSSHTAPEVQASAGRRVLLKPGWKLASPRCVPSANGRYSLCMEDNANVVLYSIRGTKTAIWASNTTYKTLEAPYVLMLHRSKPQLLAVDSTGKIFWSSTVQGNRTAGKTANTKNGKHSAVLSNDGNLAIIDSKGKAIWMTKTSIKAAQKQT